MSDSNMSIQSDHPHGSQRLLYLIPPVIAILVYLPALSFDLVWDDAEVFYNTPYLVSRPWHEILLSHLLFSKNYFRPVVVFGFLAESHLVPGYNPWLHHGVNILIHALNSFLVAWLVSTARPFRDKSIVWVLSGVVYGLHPALLEAVALITGRFDLLVTTFLILILIAENRIKTPLYRSLIIAFLFLLAALTKEMAVAFVLALPLWHLAKSSDPGEGNEPLIKRLGHETRDNFRTYVSLIAGGTAYLVIRHASLGYLLTETATDDPGTAFEHTMLVLRTLGEYLRLVFWPFTHLGPIHYGPFPVSVTSPATWVYAAVTIAVLALLVLVARRHVRPVALIGAGTAGLLPVSNIYPVTLGGGAFLAERFLVFPMTFFVIAGVPVLYRWGDKIASGLMAQTDHPSLRHFIAASPLLLFCIPASIVVLLTLPNWRNNTALWTFGHAQAPESDLPLANLAWESIQSGMYERALTLSEQAIDAQSENSNAWNNLGQAHFFLGHYAEAENAFEKAARLCPENALYWNNLASSLREQGILDQAERIIRTKVGADAGLAGVGLGLIYLRRARPDIAIEHFGRALEHLSPKEKASALELLEKAKNPELWIEMTRDFIAQNRREEALRSLKRILEFGAPSTDVAIRLSAQLIQLNAWSEARDILTAVLERAPADPRVLNNLGVVARETGDLKKAATLFSRAVEIDPSATLARDNLAALPK